MSNNTFWHIHEMEHYSIMRILKTTNISNSMDISHRSNVEQKKSDTNEVIYFDSICMMLKNR